MHKDFFKTKTCLLIGNSQHYDRKPTFKIHTYPKYIANFKKNLTWDLLIKKILVLYHYNSWNTLRDLYDSLFLKIAENQFPAQGKAIYTKYSKHWPYTVAHTIECVCWGYYPNIPNTCGPKLLLSFINGSKYVYKSHLSK